MWKFPQLFLSFVGASGCLRELYRSLHCANLNTVMAVIACTQTTEKVFHAFIFKEKRDQGKLIWSRIVDTEKAVDFPLQTEREIGRRRHWVAAIRQQGAADGLGSGSLFSQNSLSQSSHYLADSSLSQDLNRYDFTAASITPEQDRRRTVEENEAAESAWGGGGYVELEDDDMGRHPCMAQLVAVVRLMAEKDMYTVPANNKECDLPGYMKTLMTLLTDSHTQRNVKLFLLKFIYHCSDVFQPFAVHLYRPILDCVSDGTLSAEGRLNYLILDLIIMLLDWSERTGTRPSGSSSEKVAVARALALLMKNIWHTDSRIFKTNLELVRTVLSLWKEDCLDTTSLDFSIVDELLGSADRSERLGALRLLSILLENGLRDDARLKDVSFFRKVIKLAQTGQQKVSAAAARPLGLLLATAAAEQSALVANMRQLLDPLLSELAVANATEEKGRFLVVLHGVQRAYPDILADFASQFLYTMKARASEELSLCLEMLITFAPRLAQEKTLYMLFYNQLS